ncbi:MAG: TIM barrel protein [Phycisphaerales bacterium]|nr:TIM barrel protein [Phycisphaerales bacterium]
MLMTVRDILWIGLFLSAGLITSVHRASGTERAASESAYRPRVAVQLYVWTQERRRREVNPIDDLDAIFAEARSAGFDLVEGMLDWFDSDEAAAHIAGLLVKHRLHMVGVYSNGFLHDEQKGGKTIQSILERVERVKDCGLEFVNVNPDPLPEKAAKTTEQLATQTALLNQLGRRLSERGLKLLVHNHDAEIMHGAAEYRYQLAHLDPAVVGLCVDTHWIYRGGADPLALLKDSGGLVRALHVRNSVDGVWSESFGPGEVDYRPIADYLRQINFDGWLILELALERKTTFTRPLKDNVRLGRLYLESAFLQGE